MPNFPVRVIHDKFKDASKNDEIDELLNNFSYVSSLNNNIESSLKSAFEDIDPLKAYNILSGIND